MGDGLFFSVIDFSVIDLSGDFGVVRWYADGESDGNRA